MKMKVLHYYTSAEAIGGPSTYIKTICDSELKKNYEFRCCYQNKAINQLRIKDVIRIVKQIKVFNPDVLHIHGIQGEGLMGAILGKLAHCKNILMTVHGMQNDSMTNNKYKRCIYRYVVEKFALKMSDYVYCVCKSTQETDFIQKNSKILLPYVWNCVAQMPEFDRVSGREKRGYTNEDVVIVSVGRITIMKGYKVLEEVIKNDTNIFHKYLLIGDGPYLPEMKQSLESEVNSGKVMFMGRQSEIGQFLAVSDIYCTATYKENLSISILEAGYYALPCIVTDVGGNSEIVIDTDCGILVPSNDSKAINHAINDLAYDKEKASRYGINLKERIDACFSKEKFLHNIDSIYKTISCNVGE